MTDNHVFFFYESDVTTLHCIWLYHCCKIDFYAIEKLRQMSFVGRCWLFVSCGLFSFRRKL